jgi:hypothetical protein
MSGICSFMACYAWRTAFRREIIMRINADMVNELSRLLKSLRVSQYCADSGHGDYWDVYAHPHPDDNGWTMQLVIRTSDHQPVEGLRAMLESLDPKNRIHLVNPTLTNRNGNVWFEHLRSDETFSATVDPRTTVNSLTQLRRSLDSSDRFCTCDSLAGDLAADNDTISRYWEEDPSRRVRAILERWPEDGCAVVTIYSKDRGLDGASVVYRIGGESAILTLQSIEGGLPEASHHFTTKFHDVKGLLPDEVRVLPKDEDQEAT